MFNSNFPDRVPPTWHEPNLPGDRYGRLTLVEEAAGQSSRRKWLCRCDCGAEKSIGQSELRSSNTTSCGCAQRHIAAAIGRATVTHGMCKHPLFSTHAAMMRRCYSKDSGRFEDWGGRGITVCDRWHDVKNFVDDMYPSHKAGLTLERVDNNLGYGPDNCVWATKSEQARNQRSNVLVIYRANIMCLKDAAEIAGINYSTVKARLSKYGWPIPRALESEDFQAPLLESAQTPGAPHV